MKLSRQKAARMYAQRTGMTVDNAEKDIDNRASKWQDFALQNNIELITEKEAKKSICATRATEIDESLDKCWAAIQSLQDKIERALTEDDLRHLKDLTSCVAPLQKAFLDFGDIKRQHDLDTHYYVNREVVESIISDCFPELKKALNDLFVNIKQELREDVRADYDNAYNKHLPNYSKHLTKTVEKLNKLFEN